MVRTTLFTSPYPSSASTRQGRVDASTMSRIPASISAKPASPRSGNAWRAASIAEPPMLKVLNPARSRPVYLNKRLAGPRLRRLVASREGYANASHSVEYRWNRFDLRVKEIIMSRDNIREMLADIEEAVTENLSLPRYRNDNEGD